MNRLQSVRYFLGLDLGVQSLGWAIIALDSKDRPSGILKTGVRCFDSGVGSESEISAGKDESSNVARRDARLARRQTWRRARRQAKAYNLLRKVGLLPADPTPTAEDRHQAMLKLDAELFKQFIPADDRVTAHLLPYRLRALALDQALPPFALGRAFYHLSQRRGYWSNRKDKAKEQEASEKQTAAGKKDDELGKVKEGISKLADDMAQTGARTLGEYFSRIDPEEQRIRRRWTARAMFKDEFEKIWQAQAPHHPAIFTDELKNRLSSVLFHQRPLKPQAGLVGFCELEKAERRAPIASLEAQRFRYLQKLNGLDIYAPDGEIWGMRETRYAELRKKLVNMFENQAEVSFDGMRKELNLKVPRGSEVKFTFNLEAGGEKKLKGDVTRARLKKALGDEFERLSPAQMDALIADVVSYEKEDALVKRLEKVYGISADHAAAVAAVTLEDGYASLSLKAMRKLLPLMEKGVSFATARKEIYGNLAGKDTPCEKLPPVVRALPQLRNPVVARGLTELRKTVNAIIREYGKPERIRVELARDLKRSRKQREDATKQMRQNEKAREDAKKRLLAELGIEDARPGDVLKVLLADECGWICPYTGAQIEWKTLIGQSPQFDIEHIIPFSRSLDNSFANKTLCYHEENRNVKKNQTPFEAYSGDENKYGEIIARVRRFRSSMANSKLRKFKQDVVDADFSARHLQDTRYASRLASEYLGLLYGGQIDADGSRRIQSCTGGITAYLRDEWNLNAILGDGGEKNRDDHRHHAVDAVTIALADAGTVSQLNRSAARAREIGNRLFVPLDKPWPSFDDDVRKSIDAINISYRVNRRVSGALHEETNYSKPQFIAAAKKGKAPEEFRHVRKPIEMMSENEVDAIVDDVIRGLVKAQLEKLGGDPKKAFKDGQNLPYLRARDGRLIPIKKARIRKNVSVVKVGDEKSPRFVAPGSNHHMEIVALLNEAGEETTWEGCIVSLMEAAQRTRRNHPVVQRDHGSNKRFKFSLSGDEYVQMFTSPEKYELCRVTVISGNQVEFRLHNEARPITILKKIPGARIRCSSGSLFKSKARKVVVDPLGNILPAND